MREHLSREVLERYFRGACTGGEMAEIERWAAEDAARRRYLTAARRAWQEAGVVPPRFNADVGWRTVYERIAHAEPVLCRGRVPQLLIERGRERVSGRREPGMQSRVLRLSMAAAAVLLAAAVTLQPWHRLPLHGASGRVTAPPTRDYATARGQRTEILLADGTSAILSVDSRLRVPVSYGDDTRDVYLDGEAYFEVRHDARRPFRVHTVRGVAEDLGTAFAVRAYDGDTVTTVVVASGKVAIHAAATTARPPVALVAGELGRLDAAGRITVDRGVDVAAHLAWRHGKLRFRMLPLVQVARELERWYDIQIDISDSALAHVPLTATFTNRPVDEVLDVVAGTLDLRYHRQGSRVRLFSAQRAR